MYASVPTATLLGVDAVPVRVEVHVARGLPSTTIVGLPDAAVREARERVRAALLSSGLDVPRARILVNLSPADLRKEGPALDLPIAVALLAADGRVPREPAASSWCFAELSLDGRLRPARGAVAMGLAALASGARRVLVAPPDAPALAALDGLEVWTAPTLAAAVALLRGTERPAPVRPPTGRARDGEGPDPDLRDVRGRPVARLALEIAAAGGHALLLTGPPGSGKTMLARRLPGLLPDLGRAEAIEVARIRSSAGFPVPGGPSRRPPFRAPHHGVTHVGLIGGGRVPRPGEISLAHHGVLFLDELPEFPRAALETLRQPLEEGRIAIDRLRARTVLPAAFQLIAARNPCPCGWHGVEPPRCRCHPADVRRYRARVSGPLLDRIDLHATLSPVPPGELVAAPEGESSATVARRVRRARQEAARRQGVPNARLEPGRLERVARLDAAALEVARGAVRDLGLTARGYARLIRVARTLADLDAASSVGAPHVRTAAQFRRPAHDDL